jgi:serine/threonine protein kinase
MGDQTQKTTCEITFSGEESSALEPKVLNAFDLLSTIGCGAFARVVLARRKDNSKLYALKIMSKNTGNRTRSLNAFRNESNILVLPPLQFSPLTPILQVLGVTPRNCEAGLHTGE